MLKNTTIHCYDDARRLAKNTLPWMVFDYIDGAAGSGYGEQLNRNSLRDLLLQPRILRDVRQRDISSVIFGEKVAVPFGISPMGMCNLVSPHADRWLAQLAAQHHMPVGVSTVASTSLEDMAAMSEGQAWFQLYVSGGFESSVNLIDRAKAAGYKTLILTVDVPEVGRRPRELRRGFTMPFRIGLRQFFDFACHPQWSIGQLLHGKPEMANFGGAFGAFDRTASRAGADWHLLEQVRERWQGNLVVKGVTHCEDALKLCSMGVDAIQVSSHGGRQLEGAYPSILALQAIRQAVGSDMTLFYDSGMRSGEDIIKAYGLGADFVLMGRAFSFAIAAGGKQGLQEMVHVLSSEISITLAQLGLNSMAEVSADIYSQD